MTVTSQVYSEEDARHRAATCVISHAFKREHRDRCLKGCVLQRVSLDELSDITVVLGMRQSIVAMIVTTKRTMGPLKMYFNNGN